MLEVSRSIVEERLATYIEEGHALLDRASLVGDVSDYEGWKGDRSQWVEATTQGLGQIYEGPSEATAFKSAAPAQAGTGQEEYANDLERVSAAIEVLTSLHGELDASRELASASEPEAEKAGEAG